MIRLRSLLCVVTLGGVGLALAACDHKVSVQDPASMMKASKMNVAKTSFGQTSDGTAVDLYTLTNSNGLVAKISNYGATLVEMDVPDRAGKMADVVLGFDTVGGYEGKSNPYFGATTGRVA